jgi:hypothetical protein
MILSQRESQNPIAKAEAEVAKCREREAALTAQLDNAREALRRAIEARQSTLLDEDADALARANAALQSASQRETDARDRHAAAVAKRNSDSGY